MQSDPQRRARGHAETRQSSAGAGTGRTVSRRLGSAARNLCARKRSNGEIYQSPVLDSRTRQIVTVAALATLGTAAPQLRTHIAEPCDAALHGRNWSRS